MTKTEACVFINRYLLSSIKSEVLRLNSGEDMGLSNEEFTKLLNLVRELNMKNEEIIIEIEE